MARMDFDYTVDTDTDAQGGGGGLLPHMYAGLVAESITIKETKDNLGHQVEIAFQVDEPAEFKGRKFWETWTVSHPDAFNHGAYKYGKPKFDRLVRATGNDAEQFNRDPDTDHVALKYFIAEIGIQIGNAVPGKPGEFYKDKNQIDRFFYPDDQAKEPAPELGVIGDGTQGKKRNAAPVAANDNTRQASRPAASNDNTAAGAAGGARTPWGQRKTA